LATSGAGFTVFALLLVIGGFLLLRASRTFHTLGVSFLTRVEWRSDAHPARLGVLGLLVGTLIVALIAVAIAIPVGVTASLYIIGYAKPRSRRLLTNFVDLLAAVPALIYGIWGFRYLGNEIVPLARWLSRHGGWFPPFRTEADAKLVGSFFGAGVVVSLMVVPIITSITREVFAQAPVGEKEAALALGGSKWGMLRAVVIPYGRGGVVGASMLGLGRALGETIAVSLLLPQVPKLSLRIFENGGGTISGFLVQRAGSDPVTVSGLMAAGLVLFVITLGTNLVAAVVIGRSRSGAGVDL
ncbi:MAG: pstC, partial [Acidimicrobiales bacterium]|nr:pstC [Acidimicrobiales bacterium]